MRVRLPVIHSKDSAQEWVRASVGPEYRPDSPASRPRHARIPTAKKRSNSMLSLVTFVLSLFGDAAITVATSPLATSCPGGGWE